MDHPYGAGGAVMTHWRVVRCAELARMLRAVEERHGDLPVHFTSADEDYVAAGLPVGLVHVYSDRILLDSQVRMDTEEET